MFDYRYHALSLAAVLFALALGVLLGVAIGDSNLVSSAKNGIVRNLQSDLGATRHQLNTVSSEQQLERSEQNDLYGIAVHDLLANRKIGLVFLGEPSDSVDGLVRKAVTDAGGQMATVIAVREPLDVQKLAAQAAGTRYQTLSQTPEPQGLLDQFGARMAEQLIRGGRLLGRVQGTLLSSYNGQFGELQGVVIMRSTPDGMSAAEVKSAAEFESGFLSGANASRVPAVGVELSGTEPSQIPWYKSQAASSVDDLDKLGGRAALVLALAGNHGTWGIKPTADAPMPQPPLAGG